MMNGEKSRNDQQQIKGTTEQLCFYERFFQKEDRKKPNPFNRFIGSICTLILLFAPILVFSTLAVAADWRLVPKIGVSGGYDDNIFFGRENKTSSSIVNIQPGIELDYNTLLSTLRMTADFNILSYLDESDLDRVNQNYRLDGKHRLGNRWNTRAGLRFINDTTLNTFLEETGRVIERLDREYFNASAGISYEITKISSIDTDYQYEKARYEADVFPDYDRHRLNLKYRHRLKNQQDVLSIGPSFYHRTNDLNDTDYVSLDLGWERDWSNITKTLAVIGARYTNVNNNEGDDENDWGAVARFNLTRQGIASRITFRYYHDLATAANGVDINVDNFYLRYDYSLTARFGVGINGRLVFSYDLFSSEDNVQDSRYYSLEPYLNYRLTEYFNVSLRYTYQNSSQDLIDSENTSEKNSAWIEFRYELPMML